MSTTEKPSASDDLPRRERRRVAYLRRTLSRCAFVRSYRIDTANGDLSGRIDAPAYLLHNALGPILDARGLHYHVPTDAPTDAETVVTATFSEQ